MVFMNAIQGRMWVAAGRSEVATRMPHGSVVGLVGGWRQGAQLEQPARVICSLVLL
jgi:hypothetical protein